MLSVQMGSYEFMTTDLFFPSKIEQTHNKFHYLLIFYLKQMQKDMKVSIFWIIL